MSPPFVKKVLENGVTIYLTHDNLLSDDLTIVFKNYGGCLDNHTGISGFQHLLEHVFFLFDDNNIVTNAYTGFEDMGLEINFRDKRSNSELDILKKWLFKNKDYTRLDFSYDLDIDTIKRLVNELENEYLYRSLIPFDLPLNNFLASGKKYHYGGGNLMTMQKKLHEIQKWLKNPVKVPTEDIVIYLRHSYKNFLKPLEELFQGIKPVKRDEVKVGPISFHPLYNKNIQLPHTLSNELVFIIPEDLVTADELEVLGKTIHSFKFDKVVYMKEYYVSLNFVDIDDLCRTVITLEHSPNLFSKILCTYDYVSSLTYRTCFPVSFDPKLIDLTVEDYLKQESTSFNKVVDVLSQLVKEKKYSVKTPVGFFYLHKSEAGEPYNIHDINFNYKQIFNRMEPAIKLVAHNRLSETRCFQRECNLRDNKRQANPTGIYLYEKALINYYVNPSVMSLEEARCAPLRYTQDINTQLTNNTKKIFTPFDFVFLCLQSKKRDREKFDNNICNIYTTLKHLGLIYFLNRNNIHYENSSNWFIFMFCKRESMDEAINFIKSSLNSNNFNYQYEIIISEQSYIEDTNALTKKVTVSF